MLSQSETGWSLPNEKSKETSKNNISAVKNTWTTLSNVNPKKTIILKFLQ